MKKLWDVTTTVLVTSESERDQLNAFYDSTVKHNKYEDYGCVYTDEYPLVVYVWPDSYRSWTWSYFEEGSKKPEYTLDKFLAKYGVGKEEKLTNDWTSAHYDLNYTLTKEDIEKGYVRLDAYTVAKVWKIGSKDDSGALWHCFKTFPRYGEKNSKAREIQAMYAQIKALARIEGVELKD